MRKLLQIAISITLIAVTFVGCQQKKASSTSGAIASGDIVISNSGSKSLLLFSSSGSFKQVLGSLDNTSNEVYQGITKNSTTGHLLAVIDGTADSVQSFDISDGSLVGTFISNLNLTGNLRGITQLSGGDLLIVETNNVERFSSLGERRTLVNSIAWPQSLQTTGLGIEALSSGFIHCSNGAAGTTDRVTIYTDDGAVSATATAAAPAPALAGTTGVNGCAADSSGAVYAMFVGAANSYLRKYSSDLSTVEWTYTSPTILNATGIAVRSNGTVLVLNSTLNHVVQVDADGGDSHVLQGDDVDLDDLLSTPQFIYVVP